MICSMIKYIRLKIPISMLMATVNFIGLQLNRLIYNGKGINTQLTWSTVLQNLDALR
jgi:hypothetical protein